MLFNNHSHKTIVNDNDFYVNLILIVRRIVNIGLTLAKGLIIFLQSLLFFSTCFIMEMYYVALVVLLLLFAVSDLVVGVSNDAVNFLNSAIGSKSAPFWAIVSVASVGVLVGSTFSSGMMEVARKGFFDPGMYAFNEIMIIFVAVMLTDIILLDTFNSLGLPTSTTVSMVFELLGASVAVAVYKMVGSGMPITELGKYINSGKAMVVTSSILLSVMLSFTLGSLLQFIVRMIFTFNYERKIKYLGGLFAGFTITAITYFLLIKGAKDSSFVTPEMSQYISTHTPKIMVLCFIGWTLILQVAYSVFNLNILKFTVLSGTFALAMAFASNDLVNFIGVPLAGVESYSIYANSGRDASMSMGALSGVISTPTVYLILAGMIMVATLWLSRKARTVTATELSLTNQSQSGEQFGSSIFARTIVRWALDAGKVIESIIPRRVHYWLMRRYDHVESHNIGPDTPQFDLIRATVNLCVASILISIGTSFKLPLSTTYVTFMVAMGTSFADGAWGRDSAVYRITGVITVIGGWFFTAFTAFTICAIFAYVILSGGPIGLGILLILAIGAAYLSKQLHNKHLASETIRMGIQEEQDLTKRCTVCITATLTDISDVFAKTTAALGIEDRRGLHNQLVRVNDLNADMKVQKDHLSSTIREMNELSLDNGHYYVQVMDYLREAAHCLTYITNPSYEHINNNHKGLHPMQVQELAVISSKLKQMTDSIAAIVTEKEFDRIDEAVQVQQELVELINKARKTQIKRIKNEETKTRNSMLYFGIIHETKSIALHSINTLKAYRDFVLLS